MDHLDQQTQQGHYDGDIELIGLPPPLSPRSRARRLAVGVAAVALALAVVVGSIPSVRQGALTLLTGPVPTATPFTVPGASSFYFMPNAPWVTVFIDGRPLRTVPLADGHARPLRLARGTHQFEWRGAPFQAFRCQLSVPIPLIYTPRSGDCSIQPYQGLPAGYVLTSSESMATLAAAQQDTLRAAIDAALHSASSSTIVQPGESYLGPPTAQVPFPIVTASVSLHAVLRFTSALASDYSEPCELTATEQCWFPNQDCRQLCNATLDVPTAPSTAGRSAWLVAMPVHASWEFATMDGMVVGQASGGVTPDYLLAVLRIAWDGASWHATPIFGHTAGGPIADDTLCTPSRNWIEVGVYPPLPGPLVPEPAPQVIGAGNGVVYTSGPNPTDGCLLSVPPSALAFSPDPPITQPATFLYRFGVLVALNAAARQVAPALPTAGVQEQSIAQRLQAQTTRAP